MGKDRSKDYATAAFREFAFYGKPKVYELQEKLYSIELKKTKSPELAAQIIAEKMPLLLDIDAVNLVLKELKDQPNILRALDEVYFVYPSIPLKRNDIVFRIRFFAVNEGVSERAVYLWLRKARRLFAQKRGLQI